MGTEEGARNENMPNPKGKIEPQNKWRSRPTASQGTPQRSMKKPFFSLGGPAPWCHGVNWTKDDLWRFSRRRWKDRTHEDGPQHQLFAPSLIHGASCQPIYCHKLFQANAGIFPPASYMHICVVLSALNLLANQTRLKQLNYLLLASRNTSRKCQVHNAKGSGVKSNRSRAWR